MRCMPVEHPIRVGRNLILSWQAQASVMGLEWVRAIGRKQDGISVGREARKSATSLLPTTTTSLPPLRFDECSAGHPGMLPTGLGELARRGEDR